MRWWLVAVAVGGCKPTTTASSAGSGSAAVAEPAHRIAPAARTRLVAASGSTAWLVDIDAATATLAATVQLPNSTVRSLVWIGSDPLALLASSGIPDGDDDPKLDGTVGTITAAGFVALPAPPAATWAMPKPRGATHLGPFWNLIASDIDEAWLGRCEWGGIEDGGHCDDWVWARLGGPFALTSRQPPDEPEAAPWPTIAAAPGYTLTFAPKQDDEPLSTLSCKGGGAALTFPTGEHESGLAAGSLKWLSTEPPMFVVDQIVDGFEPRPHMIVFEGCGVSKRFVEPVAFTGPAGLFALASFRALSIRRNGKELASLPGAQHVAFERGAHSAHATSALAILETQLGGDMSMFAPDAIVLAPAPIAAAGAKLVPANIKSVRIDSLETGHTDDMMWFAAELQIVADVAHTYRAVELVDTKRDRVVVASFAPLKPLARVATAPAMPAATPAGSLVDLLAKPYTAGVALAGGATVFGTDPDEHATELEAAKALLGGWGKLALVVDPQVHEVHTATWGYAIATVSIAKPGGPPLRMSALVIATFDKGAWLVSAIHYLAL